MSEENNAKKLKIEANENLSNVLNEFDFVKILNENSMSKLIIIHAIKKEPPTNNKENGNHSESNEAETKIDNKNAVIIFEKPHFGLEETKSYLQINNSLDIHIENDIYKKLSIYPNRPYNGIQVQLIYPATDAHINKYSYQEALLLRETYQDWLDITSNYIKNSSFDLQWVYNILEHKTETERIVYEDPDPENGFILVPDMKWDGKTVENLYLIAIVHKKGIQSLRDLSGEHLKLLENLYEKSLSAIEEKYNLKRSMIKAYLHYQPTFYHLHVHFTNIKYQAPGFPERNHSLVHVMENLKIDSDFYKKTALEYLVKKNEPLYNLYKDRFE